MRDTTAANRLIDLSYRVDEKQRFCGCLSILGAIEATVAGPAGTLPCLAATALGERLREHRERPELTTLEWQLHLLELATSECDCVGEKSRDETDTRRALLSRGLVAEGVPVLVVELLSRLQAPSTVPSVSVALSLLGNLLVIAPSDYVAGVLLPSLERQTREHRTPTAALWALQLAGWPPSGEAEATPAAAAAIIPTCPTQQLGIAIEGAPAALRQAWPAKVREPSTEAASLAESLTAHLARHLLLAETPSGTIDVGRVVNILFVRLSEAGAAAPAQRLAAGLAASWGGGGCFVGCLVGKTLALLRTVYPQERRTLDESVYAIAESLEVLYWLGRTAAAAEVARWEAFGPALLHIYIALLSARVHLAIPPDEDTRLARAAHRTGSLLLRIVARSACLHRWLLDGGQGISSTCMRPAAQSQRRRNRSTNAPARDHWELPYSTFLAGLPAGDTSWSSWSGGSGAAAPGPAYAVGRAILEVARRRCSSGGRTRASPPQQILHLVGVLLGIRDLSASAEFRQARRVSPTTYRVTMEGLCTALRGGDLGPGDAPKGGDRGEKEARECKVEVEVEVEVEDDRSVVWDNPSDPYPHDATPIPALDCEYQMIAPTRCAYPACGLPADAYGILRLGKCSGCLEARYCLAAACQTADWRRHRTECRRAKRAREERQQQVEKPMGTNI